jgi:hypothetical protein
MGASHLAAKPNLTWPMTFEAKLYLFSTWARHPLLAPANLKLYLSHTFLTARAALLAMAISSL